MISQRSLKGIIGLFILCLITLSWFYYQGYESSIGWEVTSTAEVLEYPALQIEGQLMNFEITGEKYLLTEAYSGGRITRNLTLEVVLLSIAWVGLSVVLISASYLKRFGFILALVLFVLFVNRLNLVELGLFGSRNPLVVGGVPFLLLIGPLFFFHEFRPKTSFLLRFIVFHIFSVGMVWFGISNHSLFLDHFITHTTFTFGLTGILFLLVIAEENVFAILFLITRGKGGSSNHIHFIVLTLAYLANLILYYLNKSGYLPNSFSFFDPYILLILSSAVAIWSLRYKISYLSSYLPGNTFLSLALGLGVVFLSFVSMSFLRGTDAIFESFHYFILYFHIGFGVFFFLYIIINFIDPLVQGLEVYKIAYNEQNFPYISSRLGGLATVLGFYFLSSQEPYDLLRSGYYANLGDKEEKQGNVDIANQYYQQAGFLGYNTHFPNYKLAWQYSDKGNEYLTGTHFENAASRYPSPFAYVNYALVNQEANSVAAQASLDQAAQKFNHGEIINNRGLMSLRRNEWGRATFYFNEAEASDTWNQAPLINKWAVYKKSNAYDSSSFITDFEAGNYGAKANILSMDDVSELEFLYQGLSEAPTLHQHAYLLNGTTHFSADTLAGLATEVLNGSTNADYNDRLRKALAIFYYKKGEVNQAFKMLDYLKANAYENSEYLNDLGILALDQQAYQLAKDFFDEAVEANHPSAKIHRLEALAGLDRGEEIPDQLLAIVQQDPGLTAFANQVLANLKTSNFAIRETSYTMDLSALQNPELVRIAKKNAFDEDFVCRVVSVLNEKGDEEAYDIILEATEINPYSLKLLQNYVLIAIDQNLVNYADAALPKIQQLSSATEFETFYETYRTKRQEALEEGW